MLRKYRPNPDCTRNLPAMEPNWSAMRSLGGRNWPEENNMTLGTILIIILILILVGALPNWGHSRSWGYGPSGGLGLVLVVILVLVLMGKL
jgi:hypothetical protein